MKQAALTPDASAEPRDALSTVIMAARLGRTRKDAQEDTCTAFAAALHDALRQRGIACQVYTASPARGSLFSTWYHAVIKVGGTCYDSMGEFTEDIYRSRARIHPRVSLNVTYKRDTRACLYEDELEEMYQFYLKMLGKAMDSLHFTKASIRTGDSAILTPTSGPDDAPEAEAASPRL